MLVFFEIYNNSVILATIKKHTHEKNFPINF